LPKLLEPPNRRSRTAQLDVHSALSRFPFPSSTFSDSKKQRTRSNATQIRQEPMNKLTHSGSWLWLQATLQFCACLIVGTANHGSQVGHGASSSGRQSETCAGSAGASTNEVVRRASSAVLTPEARCLKGIAVRPPQPGGDWGRRASYSACSHGRPESRSYLWPFQSSG